MGLRGRGHLLPQEAQALPLRWAVSSPSGTKVRSGICSSLVMACQ